MGIFNVLADGLGSIGKGIEYAVEKVFGLGETNIWCANCQDHTAHSVWYEVDGYGTSTEHAKCKTCGERP